VLIVLPLRTTSNLSWRLRNKCRHFYESQYVRRVLTLFFSYLRFVDRSSSIGIKFCDIGTFLSKAYHGIISPDHFLQMLQVLWLRIQTINVSSKMYLTNNFFKRGKRVTIYSAVERSHTRSSRKTTAGKSKIGSRLGSGT
jgi:hypothetical protein